MDIVKLNEEIAQIVARENVLRAETEPAAYSLFISSHPGSTMESMTSLEAETKELNFHLEQVQDFTPPPMTMATEMYYTGINPETGDKIFCAKNMREKEEQRLFFFWYKKEEQARIRALLKKMGRQDILRSCLNFIGK